MFSYVILVGLLSYVSVLFLVMLVWFCVSLMIMKVRGSMMLLSFGFKLSVVLLLFSLLLMLGQGDVSIRMVFFGSGVWFPYSLSLSFDKSSLMFLLVGWLVSWSIFNFGIRYMSDEPKKIFFMFSLSLFLFFMMLLVCSVNFFTLFVSWESVSILSFVLISWWFGRMDASNNSLQAVYYNRVGDFGMLMFMGSLLSVNNDFMMFSSELCMHGSMFILLFLAIMSKSSMFLFHPWLPNAMESPTPVSSLLHSSTMVVASVYLMMRLLLEVGVSYSLVLVVGLLTSLLSGIMAMHQNDMKKIIAYSTTSQLSFMMFSLSLGLQYISMMYLVSHAFFKAMIFMVSGVFIHSSVNNQDVRVLGYSAKVNGFGLLLLMLGSFVMMSFPFLTSFWSKDIIVESFFGSVLNRGLFVLVFLSLVSTSVYSLRMMIMLASLYSNLGMKIMGMESFSLMTGYLRLIMLSLLGSFMLAYFYYPFDESVSLGQLKFMPLFFMLLGLVMSMIMLGFNYSKFLYFVNYLLYYNPLLHKLLSSVKYSFSKVYLYLDLMVLEFVLPRGVFSLVSDHMMKLVMSVFLVLFIFWVV